MSRAARALRSLGRVTGRGAIGASAALAMLAALGTSSALAATGEMVATRQTGPLASAPAGGSLQWQALTSAELRAQLDGAPLTVLLPIGGTEQSGAHMALGKHNARVAAIALQVAQRLPHTLVAPVLAYVPEGAIDPPSGHMRYAGTISVPQAAFEGVLEGAARSLCRHGVRHVVLLGDHGGYQDSLDRVARRLEAHSPPRASPAPPGQRAASAGCRVHALPAYYRAASEGVTALLRERGYSAAEIGSHAGLADTALALAVDPTLVRADKLARSAREPGVSGDARRASAELGRAALELVVATTVREIRALAPD